MFSLEYFITISSATLLFHKELKITSIYHPVLFQHSNFLTVFENNIAGLTVPYLQIHD